MAAPDPSPTRGRTVFTGALALSACSALLTVGYCTFKRAPRTAPLAIQAGINGGVVGIAFFGVREYLVTPSLASTSESATGSFGYGPVTTEELRWHQVTDSALSGGLVSGILYGIRSSSVRAILMPGFTTGALLFGLGQYAYNHARIQRINYVASGIPHRERSASSAPLEPVLSTSPTSPSSSSSDPWTSPDWSSPPRPALWERALTASGLFRPMSDEDYLRRLHKQRAEALRRIEEFEREIEVEESQAS